MIEFNYTAISSEGKITKGNRTAENLNRLVFILAEENLELIEAKEKISKAKINYKNFKVKTAEISNFLFEIGIQLKAGVSILEALKTKDEESAGRLLIIRQRLSYAVEQGLPISEGMKEFPKVFQNYIINIVKVGEKSGALPENLMELRSYLEWMDRNWKTLKQALTYPSMVMLVLIIFIFVALKFIFPNILGLLYELNVTLPWITKVVIAASDIVVKYWIFIISLFFIIPVGFGLLFRFSQKAVFIKDKFLLALPYLGDVILNLSITRFIKSLVLSQKAGIVITDALKLSQEVVGNKVIEERVSRIGRLVSNGKSISSSIEKDPVFPKLVKTMIEVGEKSGSLDDSLKTVIDYYDDLIPRKIKLFFSILEPALIILTVGIAGFIAAAVFLPLVELLNPGAFL